QSYMRSLMRATAEAHGKIYDKADSSMHWRRDPLVAEAMVDHRVIVPGLIDSTKVLTFTPQEAMKWGYSDGTVNTLPKVLETLGYADAAIERYQPTLTNKILGFLSSTAVQAVLIMIIIGGIGFELKSPGLGFPAAAALVSAVLYFLPMCVTGVVAGWVIILFIIGIVALAMEVFVIPGFGVAGITGVLAIAGSIIIALIQKESLMGITLQDVAFACMVFMISLVVALALVWYLSSRFGPRFVRRTIELERAQFVEDGYVGVDMAPAAKIGASGVTLTDMRPSGKVMIDGETYDAVALNGFVEAGTGVTVAKYENSQLYVK
ncbi:MAG: nodulation protein NfeD, partial [Muribaculaceae bacterium]|nr:nodulation protein NfeD [Muribaculaceae bacterium]